ncbi:glycosyl transferase family 1 [Spirochaetia bacterium]|nr:glycosyl transferase family 1 [Spirochaetia bacterium]
MNDAIQNKRKSIFFVVNVDWFFISHRLPLALHALKVGYDVYVLTSDTGRIKELVKYGIQIIIIPFKRSGTNIFHELKCILLLRKYYCRYKPDIIHHVSLKAALLGSLAAKLTKYRNVINAISGFGYNFTDGRNGIIQKIIRVMINISFKNNFYFILQNNDDIDMVDKMHLCETSHLILIKGSGVDLNEYVYTSPNKTDCVYLLFPARMLRDKGILEYIKAAKSIRTIVKGRAKFILAGDFDDENFASMKKDELLELLEDGYIEWIGYQKEMFDVYKSCDIVVLPSYREGLPKSLIEAGAVGRPVITTDVPGCKECVIDGYNGIIVPVKNISDLAKAMLTLINNADLRLEYGQNSRILAEKEFSLDSVIRSTFNLYDRMLNLSI